MSRKDLLAALKERPLLCDGAMGTQLIGKGLMPGACGEKWNLENADAIVQIHRAYRQAGCDLITTNTFGASRPALEKHGLADKIVEINREGARLARAAAGDDAWVLGDIGPFGGFLEPIGEMSPGKLLEIFVEQAQALRDGGADAIVIETMVDPAEAAIAIKAAKQVANWPVIATYAFNKAERGIFKTIMGSPVKDAMRQAIDAGADVVGANCGTALDLKDYQRLAKRLVATAGRTPVILQPNCGAPKEIDGQFVYTTCCDAMAQIVPPLLNAGVRIIGGCCGTTPGHLRKMGAALRSVTEVMVAAS